MRRKALAIIALLILGWTILVITSYVFQRSYDEIVYGADGEPFYTVHHVCIELNYITLPLAIFGFGIEFVAVFSGMDFLEGYLKEKSFKREEHRKR